MVSFHFWVIWEKAALSFAISKYPWARTIYIINCHIQINLSIRLSYFFQKAIEILLSWVLRKIKSWKALLLKNILTKVVHKLLWSLLLLFYYWVLRVNTSHKLGRSILSFTSEHTPARCLKWWYLERFVMLNQALSQSVIYGSFMLIIWFFWTDLPLIRLKLILIVLPILVKILRIVAVKVIH